MLALYSRSINPILRPGTMLICHPCLSTCFVMNLQRRLSSASSLTVSLTLLLLVHFSNLLWLHVHTSPSLWGVLTHHLKSPTYASCKVASCRVWHYLSRHPGVSIVYTGSAMDLHAHTDSDWGSDRHTRRSTSGIVIMAGGLVHWLSKLQPIVTVSSMQAEYIACFFSVQEVAPIQILLVSGRDLDRYYPVINRG
jgi:hypothetical protein